MRATTNELDSDKSPLSGRKCATTEAENGTVVTRVHLFETNLSKIFVYYATGEISCRFYLIFLS